MKIQQVLTDLNAGTHSDPKSFNEIADYLEANKSSYVLYA